MVNVIILGAGGHGKVIADIIKNNGDIVLGFLDDNPNKNFSNYSNLGNINSAERLLKQNLDIKFIIGIGDNTTRERIAKAHPTLPFYTAIHTSAVISPDCSIAPGTVVMANCVINTGTIIGKHCIINTASTVDHDCILKDFVHISPGSHLAGTVHIGNNTWLGIGSIVSNNISICDNVIIGAGSVVLSNITQKGVYFGTPAKLYVNSINNNMLHGGGEHSLVTSFKSLIQPSFYEYKEVA